MAARDGVTFGLLGRTLGHSWSPRIHAALGSFPYELVELEPDEVAPFIREGSWRGLNVTIPYKRVAAEAADVTSERVDALGVANTLVRRPDGRVFADNTDVLGFEAMLDDFCLRELGSTARGALEGSKALVLGTGGAAQAVSYALREGAGCEVAFVSRSGDSTYDNLLDLHSDASLVVNTTPVGMYPNCPASPLADGVLDRLSSLRGVLDVVYNPLRTGICQQAERVRIPSQSGLSMLVWQAIFASELFQGRDLDKALFGKVMADLLNQCRNVALIGMPGAGKSTTGRALARLTRRPFVDLDEAFEVAYGMPPAECIRTQGEPAFRAKECEVLAEYAAKSGLVIACGGGVVTQPQNYAPLHQNATIVMLERELDQLALSGRPISVLKGIELLAQERMPTYHAWADFIVRCTGSPTSDAATIRDLLEM